MTAKPIDWQKLARAETCPLRVQLLEAIADASEPCSPSQLAKAVEQPLGNVSYHVRQLEAAGMVVLSRTEPRRGAAEHFYVLAGGER